MDLFESISLVLHIGSGIVGIVTGYAALFLPKGQRLHRAAGTLFFVAIPVNGTTASILGYLHDDIGDVFGGLMVIYFATTAWVAARRRDGEVGWFERAALGLVLVVIGADAYFVAGAPSALTKPTLIAMGVMTLAAACDLRVILRHGLHGRQRVARHLWRMCLSLFGAAGPLFLGQMQVFPESLRRIEIMAVPVVIPVLMMVYWLIRIRYVRLDALHLDRGA